MPSINFNKFLKLGNKQSPTGTYSYDKRTGTLTVSERTTVFRPKTAAVFEYLVDNSDRVVSKTELLNKIWQGVIVQEQAVFQSITEIRQAFANPKCIRTHPRKGYQWSGSVSLTQPSWTSFDALLNLAIAIAVIIVIVAASLYDPKPHGGRPLIAVYPAIQKTAAARDTGLPTSLADMLTHHISANGIGTALPPSELPPIAEGIEPDFRTALESSGADIIMQLSTSRTGAELRVDFIIANEMGRLDGSYTHTSVTWIVHQIAHQLHDAATYSLLPGAPAVRLELHKQKMQAEHMRHIGNRDTAITLLEDIAARDPSYLSAAFELLGNTWQTEGGTTDIALAAFLSMAQQHGDAFNEIRAMKLQSRRAALLGNHKLAITIAEEGRKLSDNRHYPYLQTSFAILKGRWENALGNISGATLLLEEAVIQYQQMECPAGELAVHEMLANNYDQLGRNELAEEARKKAEALRILGY